MNRELRNIELEYEDCACCHGVDCFDPYGTCVYCGFKRTDPNQDCIDCEKEFCDPDCFNKHPGSMIALGKLIKENESKHDIGINLVADQK